MSGSNRKTAQLLIGVGCGMLALGFASKPLYDTFCKVTGYGGTVKTAESNSSEVLGRDITVFFDSNTAPGLPWDFKPEQDNLTVKVGQSGLAYYKVKNLADYPVTGTATFNVTPIKAAPVFIKTECFCFTEQTLQPGQEMSFPVLFHVDSQIADETRLDDVKEMTLSYTFFETEPTQTAQNLADISLGQDDAKQTLN